MNVTVELQKHEHPQTAHWRVIAKSDSGNLLKREIEHSVYGALRTYRDMCEDYNVDAFEESFNFYVVKFPWSRPVKADIKEEIAELAGNV